MRNQDSKKYIFIVLSVFMLSLGFLTKGFVAFFPWTFPFLLWIILKKKSFGKMAIDSAGLLFFTITPLILISLISASDWIAMHKYVDNQVIDSIRHVINVNFI